MLSVHLQDPGPMSCLGSRAALTPPALGQPTAREKHLVWDSETCHSNSKVPSSLSVQSSCNLVNTADAMFVCVVVRGDEVGKTPCT